MGFADEVDARGRPIPDPSITILLNGKYRAYSWLHNLEAVASTREEAMAEVQQMIAGLAQR